jgi:anti-anti-sigma factor
MGHHESFILEVLGNEMRVAGEIDMSNSARVLAAALKLEDPIRVDLGGVTFMDSSGLHALLRLLAARPSMRIVGASPQVDRVLTLTDTAHLFAGRPGA